LIESGISGDVAVAVLFSCPFISCLGSIKMEKEEQGSSPLAIIVVVIVFLVLYFLANYRPEDFETPPQFTVLAEVFAEKCQSASADCKAVLQDGSGAVVSFNMTLLGPQILIHPDVKDGKIIRMGLGKFLRDGGLIIFGSADSYL
jgi:hypothetical protein